MSSVFTSPGRHHAIWKEWRRIGKGQDSRFFLEHRQAVIESLETGHPPQQVLLSRSLYESDPLGWEEKARRGGARWYLLDGESLDQVASVPTNSGLCGLFDPQPIPLEGLLGKHFLLIAWEISDPGNLGTLVRCAQALGEGGILVVGGCQPWTSKVARASAGTLLKAHVSRVTTEKGQEVLMSLRNAGFSLKAAFPRAATSLNELEWAGRAAVVLGNETRGLPLKVEQITLPFRIPMASEVESLNVAMTGSIVCWEWRRHNAGGVASWSLPADG